MVYIILHLATNTSADKKRFYLYHFHDIISLESVETLVRGFCEPSFNPVQFCIVI